MIRAVLFDAGHTLLEFDDALLTAQLIARGHDVDAARVTEAERYLLGDLGISGEDDLAAITAWRRGFNLPVGLCHQADAQAADALSRLRAAGLIIGVIPNSNGSVAQALERAGLAPLLDFVIDSTVARIAKPDPRVFALGLQAADAERATSLTSP